jgi:hypothetical protein
VRIHSALDFNDKLRRHYHDHNNDTYNEYEYNLHFRLKLNNSDISYNDIHVLELHEYDLHYPYDHVILNRVHGDADE